MARKPKHEEHENHERWLVSYADFITLLFAFFVVMYSLSAVNEGKFRVLSESLVAAFRSNPKSMEPIQMGQPTRPELSANNQLLMRSPQANVFSGSGVSLPPKPISEPVKTGSKEMAGEERSASARAIKEIAEKVADAMGALIEKDLVTVRRFRYWVEVEIKTNILFPSGSALLEPRALPVLKEIASVLNEYPNRVQVEGFTDNVPIRSAVHPSNWELSAARAMSVVQAFIRGGVRPTRLSLVGFGEYRPIADNATEEGRARNRRVVIVIMSEEDETQRLRDMTTQTAEEPVPHQPAPAAKTAPSSAVKAPQPATSVQKAAPAVKPAPAPAVTPPATAAPSSAVQVPQPASVPKTPPAVAQPPSPAAPPAGDRPRSVSPVGMYEIVLPRLPSAAPIIQPIPKPITPTPGRGE